MAIRKFRIRVTCPRPSPTPPSCGPRYAPPSDRLVGQWKTSAVEGPDAARPRPAVLSQAPSGPEMESPEPRRQGCSARRRQGRLSRTVARERLWRGTARGTGGQEIPPQTVR